LALKIVFESSEKAIFKANKKSVEIILNAAKVKQGAKTPYNKINLLTFVLQ
jgi:hypothetical protein